MLILDGGLGTEIERMMPLKGHRLWSAALLRDEAGRDILTGIHSRFAACGADIVSTATYQWSLKAFEEVGVGSEDAATFLRNSVSIARSAVSAAGSSAKIAASLGSYGAVLGDMSEFTGKFDIGFEDLKKFHEERLQLLLADSMVQPDFVAFETIPSVKEVRAIVSVLDSLLKGDPSFRVWVSMCVKIPGPVLGSGETLASAFEVLNQCQFVHFVGFNCSSLSATREALLTAQFLTIKPLVAYPNRSETFEAGEWKTETGVTTNDLKANMLAWKASVPQLEIFGGCCRITAEDIKEIASAFKSSSQESDHVCCVISR